MCWLELLNVVELGIFDEFAQSRFGEGYWRVKDLIDEVWDVAHLHFVV